MRRLAAVVVVALVWVTLAGVAAADGPVTAAASLDKRGITIGDPMMLTVVVETDPGYQITDSGVSRSMGEFEVLEALSPQVVRQSGGRSRYTFKYRVTTFRVGDLVFPAISVGYQGGGTTGVAPTEEIPIVVTSVIRAGENADDVKPLKPQLRMPGASQQIPPIVVQAALAVVVLAFLALIVRQALKARRPEPAVVLDAQLTPAQRAMAELNRIAALRLPEKGRFAEHYALLSAALRAYVRDRFGLAATERTPKELRDDMLRAGIDRTEVTTIYEVLREGEVARFHRTTSYPARAHHAVRSALDAMRRAAVAEQFELMEGRPA